MEILLKTLSPLLCSTGESSAWIDADVRYDRHGFPYIQAKTFKGLMRESALEVCEICKMDKSIVDRLFGIKGRENPGELRFNNLLPEGYNNEKVSLERQKGVLRPSFVKSHFTITISQTNIDEGVAEDKSLRKYRLIKEGTLFETTIDNVTEEHFDFIKNTILNLRYFGTRRNRGFGKVKLTNSDKVSLSTIQGVNGSITPIGDSYPYKLYFTITTKDPVVIAKIFGEQNTVSTLSHIPPQLIRGLVASLIMDKEKITTETTSGNPLFRELVLDNNVGYHPAFPVSDPNYEKVNYPVPRAYGYTKIVPDSPLEIIFGNEKHLIPEKGFGHFEEDIWIKNEVSTSFSFHHSRNENRLAGRSTKNDGAIFYYESIDEGEVFQSCITGSFHNLKYLEELLGSKNGEHQVGKARSAQYSRLTFSNFKIFPLVPRDKIVSPAYITFLSPTITYNTFGVAVPDLDMILNEIELICGIKIENTCHFASSADFVENYLRVWQSKTPREAAFQAGSTIRIEFSGLLDIDKLEKNGLGERKAEGYGRISILPLPQILIRSYEEKDKDNYNTEEIKSNPFPQGGLLFNLFEQQATVDFITRLDQDAVDFGSKYTGKIPNSLLSRLRNNLIASQSMESWTLFMNNIKGKKAEETLEKYLLMKPVSGLEIANDKAEELKKDFNRDLSFDNKKHYWSFVFATMREKNNKNEIDHEQQ
ncbi:MAG: RAMP superfamily CRISPR-associated protein [Bacteroidales bacterium]|nr:RAMP superfamily CRISPR-associated protein [Bacteroidales bacterium]